MNESLSEKEKVRNSNFGSRPTRAKRMQAVSFWGFRIITYSIILFATYIFADITWNGSKTVFKSSFPFVNTEFFTGFPETLYVLDWYTVETAEGEEEMSGEAFSRAVRDQNRSISKIDYHFGKFTFLFNFEEQGPMPAEKFFAFLQQEGVTLKVLSYEELEMASRTFDEWRKEKGIPLGDYLGAENYAYSGGGILPNIVGTFLLTIFAVIIALVLGTLAAVFLSEYSRPGKMLNTIRLSILNLAGVPSIVFGIFGFGAFVLTAPVFTDAPAEDTLFAFGTPIKNVETVEVLPRDEAAKLGEVTTMESYPNANEFEVTTERWKLFGIPLPGRELMSLEPVTETVPTTKEVQVLNRVSFSFQGWNVSLMAGAFTLAFMVLPVIIAASEESLRAIPRGFREGSLALGATKWTSIRTNVIPYALPGILTSSILGITRVAGETAPIMFTAAYASAPGMPWDKGFWNMFMEPVMALPYHIYVVSLKIPQNEYTEKMQYGTAFVFMVIVGLIAFSSIVLRVRARKKYQW